MKKHTLESISLKALQYTTRSQFQKDSRNEYNAALRRGILGQVCSHMDVVLKIHTLESISLKALQYTTRSEFQTGANKEYKSAIKRGILEEVCSHMRPALKIHTLESISLKALQYTTRMEFSKCSRNEYDAARRRGILDEVCNHMPKTVSGRARFVNAPAMLYLVLVDSKYLKLGITKFNIQTRYAQELARGQQIELLAELWFQEGTQAFDTEQMILQETQEHQCFNKETKDSGPLVGGNTEIREICILDDLLEAFETLG